MFFVVVAFIKPVLYMENRLIQYNISRSVTYNNVGFRYDLFISIFFLNTNLLRTYYNSFNPFVMFMNK